MTASVSASAALGIGEVRRLAPRGHREETLIGLAGFPHLARARLDEGLQPLIWLACRWLKASVSAGTPARKVDLYTRV